MAPPSEYGVVRVAPETDRAVEADPHRSLTDELGAEELSVDAYRLADGRTVDLLPGHERVVVPLASTAPVTLDGRYSLDTGSVGRLAPDRPCTLGGGDATVLVVSAATTDADTTEPVVVDLDAVEYVTPSTSDVVTAHLTGPLGCTGMKVNARVLEPGQHVQRHVEGSQEELFVPFSAGAAIVVGDDRIATPPGTAVRVAADAPRSARNDGEMATRWLMFGAPPTGGPTEWDPGAKVLE